MRVLRGRGGSIAADRRATRDMLDRAGATGEPAVRVWSPHRQVAFGRRDATADGYGAAREAARERGFPPVERDVGGRAVAHTGATVAFARAEPVADARTTIDDRYADAARAVQRALWRLGVPAARGEPDQSFCPGSHSLRHRGKIAGLAQRVRQDAALVAGVVLVDDREAFVDVLGAVYGALGLPLNPAAVGSVARSGGRGDPSVVAATVEDLLVGDADATVVRVGE